MEANPTRQQPKRAFNLSITTWEWCQQLRGGERELELGLSGKAAGRKWKLKRALTTLEKQKRPGLRVLNRKRKKATLAVSGVRFPERKAWHRFGCIVAFLPFEAREQDSRTPWQSVTGYGYPLTWGVASWARRLSSGGWAHWPGKGNLDGTPLEPIMNSKDKKA